MSININAAVAGGPEVNMANGNAAQILDLLGVDDIDGGVLPAQDFLGRVLLAQALASATVDDEHGRPDFTDGRWYHGGRRPGYIAGKLAELHEVAIWAAERDVEVVWG